MTFFWRCTTGYGIASPWGSASKDSLRCTARKHQPGLIRTCRTIKHSFFVTWLNIARSVSRGGIQHQQRSWSVGKARALQTGPGRGTSPESQKAPQLCSRSGSSAGTVKLLRQDRFLRCRRNELSRMFDSLNQHLLTFSSWEQLLMHTFPSVGIVRRFDAIFFVRVFNIKNP